MKKIYGALAVFVIFAVMVSTMAFAGEKAPDKVVALAEKELVALGTDPAIVAAVKEQNAKGMTLDQVKAKDEAWKNTAGVTDEMKAMMESACGKRLTEILNGADYFAEIFVMDNLGANVAMTDKTSDYWQGDEAKWQESFKGGQGGVHISEVEFDESTQTYLVQISVPVKDGDQAIGAITFGVDVDKVQ